MYTMNLSSLESPDLTISQFAEYSQDFNTEIDYEEEILPDYADQSYDDKELKSNTIVDDDFFDYSNEMFLYKEYSSEYEDDFEYNEASISNDQIMLENIRESI